MGCENCMYVDLLWPSGILTILGYDSSKFINVPTFAIRNMTTATESDEKE